MIPCRSQIILSFVLNYNWINYSSFAWIHHSFFILLEYSSWASLIYNDIKQLRLIVRLELRNCFFKLPTRSFKLQTFLKECRSSNSISVDNNLLWDLSIIVCSIVLKSIQNEVRKDVCTISTDFLLLFIFRIFLLASRIFSQIIIMDFSIVLSKERSFSGCQRNNTFDSMVYNIKTNKHGKIGNNLFAHLNSVKIFTTFGIYLPQKI